MLIHLIVRDVAAAVIGISGKLKGTPLYRLSEGQI